MTKISTILGTRPEAIKLSPVILALRARGGLHCHVCVTAQHRELLDQMLDVFGIHPDTDLDLLRPDQTLPELTSRAIPAIDRHLQAWRPDLVLIQGDTTTVLCAALAAFYRGVPVGHVEAGLRTGDLRAPWPEEANRALAARLVTLHFAPTETNRQNLLREGIPDDSIHVTGNTVIDALLYAREKIRESPPEIPGLPEGAPGCWGDDPVVLITGHRRESFGDALESMCRAYGELARRHPGAHFVYAVHLNPNVRGPVERVLGGEASPGNLHLVDPLPYLPFVALMDRARLILTDSGGIQEEAPTLGKPVLVTREVTERPEAVEAGTVKLVGTDHDRIVKEASRLLDDEDAAAAMSRVHNPYGDGRATGRIIDACLRFLESRKGEP